MNTSSGGFFNDWFARVTKIQSEQPHWITPMTTVTPRLEEELRYDQSWETTSSGSHNTSFGGGKGLELIPCENVEVILGIPAWTSHSNPKDKDGFGDESFLMKYRIASANEENGNYIVTAYFSNYKCRRAARTTRATITPSLPRSPREKDGATSMSRALWGFPFLTTAPRARAPARRCKETTRRFNIAY